MTPDYDITDKQALKPLKDFAFRETLNKFLSHQSSYYKERSYESSAKDLRQADVFRGMVKAYETLLAELDSLANRL